MPTTVQVTLDVFPERRAAFVREPRGSDEEELEGRFTGAAIRYLDRLLVDLPGAHVRPGDAGKLTARERDLLFAAVHKLTFGGRIEGTLTCGACSARFDLDFDLDAFAASVAATKRAPVEDELRDGTFATDDGRRFRLATGEDECSVVSVPEAQREAALLRRCMVDGELPADPGAVLSAMSAFAPVLDDELEAACAECGASSRVHFDVQSYHLGSMEAARQSLAYDVHRLAASYGWSLGDILGLARSSRRRYVAILEAQPSAGARP